MSYIQLFNIDSGGTISPMDSGNTLQVTNLQVTNIINSSGTTVDTSTLVTSGTTQTISGVKSFTGGILVTGLTLNGKSIDSGNFLSANTSYYTQAQANANFLSANTSYYTQAQTNANFVSGLTLNNRLLSYYNSAQTNANFLSANTSYYTQAQTNANFLSANTSYYTQAQTNANFVSAATWYAIIVFNNNATATSSSASAIKVAGTNYTGGTVGYTVTQSAYFNISTNNRITYNQAISNEIKIDVSGDLVPTSTHAYIISIVKNGNPTGNTLADVEIATDSSGTAATRIPFVLHTIDIPTHNDFYEIWLNNASSATVVRDLQFIITKI